MNSSYILSVLVTYNWILVKINISYCFLNFNCMKLLVFVWLDNYYRNWEPNSRNNLAEVYDHQLTHEKENCLPGFSILWSERKYLINYKIGYIKILFKIKSIYSIFSSFWNLIQLFYNSGKVDCNQIRKFSGINSVFSCTRINNNYAEYIYFQVKDVVLGY